MHIACNDCFKKIGPLEEDTRRGMQDGEGSCAYCREWLTEVAWLARHILPGQPRLEHVLKLRRCQAEDQGGWPCNATPIVFQLTEAEVKKNDGEQAYFCKAHRTSRHVWHESETELIPPLAETTNNPVQVEAVTFKKSELPKDPIEPMPDEMLPGYVKKD